MDLLSSISLLKNKIDNFQYGKDSKGNSYSGLKALRIGLKDTYKADEAYISREIKKLYERLTEAENNKIVDEHFTFLKDIDLFYTILKMLDISFEELMDGKQKEKTAPTELSRVNDHISSMEEKLNQLVDIVQLDFTKTNRSSATKKLYEYTSLMIQCCSFNSNNLEYLQLEEQVGPDTDKITIEHSQISFQIITQINSLSGIFIDFKTLEQLSSQKIPIEFLEMQYYRCFEQNRLSDISKALLILNDNSDKYYEKLAKKLERILNNNSTTNDNYIRYSSIVYQFDFINRITIGFTRSLFNNFKYKTVKNLNETKINNIYTLNYGIITSWNDYFKIIKSNSLKLSYKITQSNVEQFYEKLLEKTSSLLKQLSKYLFKTELYKYTHSSIKEIQIIFNTYVHIISTIIFQNNWEVKFDNLKMIENVIEQLEQHTIIISKDLSEAIYDKGFVDDE